MTVEDLMKILPRLDRKAHITVNGEIVDGVDEVTVRVKKGHFTDSITIHPKGREKAIRFTRSGEMSDGKVDLLPV